MKQQLDDTSRHGCVSSKQLQDTRTMGKYMQLVQQMTQSFEAYGHRR